MTVAELIDTLRRFEPDLPVVVLGYETGVDDVLAAKVVPVRRDVNRGAWFDGHHSIDETGEPHVLIKSRRNE